MAQNWLICQSNFSSLKETMRLLESKSCAIIHRKTRLPFSSVKVMEQNRPDLVAAQGLRSPSSSSRLPPRGRTLLRTRAHSF
ncbi:hypothetical protein Y032_0348g3167 [Ancylostoma ceylanicum]|uniref:Uncharacterized protein n=1 Tax=Ancylostoma ceylanicum TaxID=53326 RepID=A0A016RXP1_9BILA|nr:hypothetical protein Y032_0348g3167 [Ancylostoma ceylanicum]